MFKTILIPRFEGVPLLPAANDLALNGGRTYGFPLWRMLGFVNIIIAIIFITGLGHVYLGYEFQHISCSLSCTLTLFSCLDYVWILSFGCCQQTYLTISCLLCICVFTSPLLFLYIHNEYTQIWLSWLDWLWSSRLLLLAAWNSHRLHSNTSFSCLVREWTFKPPLVVAL